MAIKPGGYNEVACRSSRAWAVLLLLAFPARAADDSGFVLNDPEQGLVRTGPAPRFPPTALAGRLAGYVDVTGVILPIQEMSEDSITADREETAVFADAVREVLPGWRFNPPLDEECVPAREPVRLRIHFEWNADRPGIRVMHEPIRRLPFPNAGLKVLHRVAPRYPLTMLMGGYDGVVYSRMDIAPDGSVGDLRSRAFGTSPGNGQALVQATNHALQQWRFNAAPPGSSESRMWCQTMWFHTR